MGETWTTVVNFSKEITRKERIPEEQMSSLIGKLALLESTFGEEYYILAQAKTLQHMTKEINQTYRINLINIKKILANIIKDEENHMELLETIKQIYEKKVEVKTDRAPTVKYQNPDSWARTTPTSV